MAEEAPDSGGGGVNIVKDVVDFVGDVVGILGFGGGGGGDDDDQNLAWARRIQRRKRASERKLRARNQRLRQQLRRERRRARARGEPGREDADVTEGKRKRLRGFSYGGPISLLRYLPENIVLPRNITDAEIYEELDRGIEEDCPPEESGCPGSWEWADQWDAEHPPGVAQPPIGIWREAFEPGGRRLPDPRTGPRLSRGWRSALLVGAIEAGRRFADWLFEDEDERAAERAERMGRRPVPRLPEPELAEVGEISVPMPTLPGLDRAPDRRALGFPAPQRAPRARAQPQAFPEPRISDFPGPDLGQFPAPTLPPAARPSIDWWRLAELGRDVAAISILGRGLDTASMRGVRMRPDRFADPFGEPQRQPQGRCGVCPPCTRAGQKRTRKKRKPCLYREPVTIQRCVTSWL